MNAHETRHPNWIPVEPADGALKKGDRYRIEMSGGSTYEFDAGSDWEREDFISNAAYYVWPHPEPTPHEATTETIDIVFDGPPAHESGRFVEVENSVGQSVRVGEWVERPDGYWVLRIDRVEVQSPEPKPYEAVPEGHANAAVMSVSVEGREPVVGTYYRYGEATVRAVLPDDPELSQFVSYTGSITSAVPMTVVPTGALSRLRGQKGADGLGATTPQAIAAFLAAVDGADQ